MDTVEVVVGEPVMHALTLRVCVPVPDTLGEVERVKEGEPVGLPEEEAEADKEGDALAVLHTEGVREMVRVRVVDLVKVPEAVGLEDTHRVGERDCVSVTLPVALLVKLGEGVVDREAVGVADTE